MSRPHFIDFPVVDQPELADALIAWDGLAPLPGEPFERRSLLVLYQNDGARDFMLDIFTAAGYTQAEQQAWLLPWPGGRALDLAALVRHLGVSRVILFGQELPAMGLHLNLAPYVAVNLAGVWYLSAHSLLEIRDQKIAGDSKQAAALWQALKTNFLFTQLPDA